MKAIVIYSSKTGFTKKYGDWIAEELGCKAFSLKEAKKSLTSYDTIIFGGGVIAGKISGLNKVKSSNSIQGKNLILFATGATKMEDIHMIADIKNKNLTEEEKDIPFFYFEAGINYDKMSFPMKAMCKMIYKSLLKKENLTEEEKGMLKLFEKSSDHSNKGYTQPLIDYVRGL